MSNKSYIVFTQTDTDIIILLFLDFIFFSPDCNISSLFVFIIDEFHCFICIVSVLNVKRCKSFHTI
jgi:hypothetical protein